VWYTGTQKTVDVEHIAIMTEDSEHGLRVYEYHCIGEAESDEVVSGLESILKERGQDEIFDQMAYCLRELMDNAAKANLKRIYFADQGLRIDQPGDYQRGMRGFRGGVEQERERLEGLQEASDLVVRICFREEQGDLRLTVENNVSIQQVEYERILNKLRKARLYTGLDEFFEEVEDETESAGLGLVMLILILRKLGIGEDGFAIERGDSWTRALLVIPPRVVSEEATETVGEALSGVIDSIPQFPDHINKLSRQLDNPSFSFDKATQLIRRDPALTVEVLRMANSPVYRRFERVERLSTAVSMLGTRGLRNIIQSFGAQQALKTCYPPVQIEELWQHSAVVADVATLLCRRVRTSEEDAEYIYMGALLHDIGKIVLYGQHPETARILNAVCRRKDISVNAVEDLVAGVRHALIGARMAEHWQLPDRITELIRYYQTPLSAPMPIRSMAKIVFLAHMVVHRILGEVREYEWQQGLLKEFGLGGYGSLDDFVEDARRCLNTQQAE
jgi:putative nucleotidyltransferase with HDIG domain